MNNLNKRFPRYSKLLKAYPKPYREQYGHQMLQTLADMLDDTLSQNRRLAVWVRTAADLPVSVARQQLNYAGGIMAHEMPNYVKRNALASTVLLVPFILALIANGADKVINNRTLYNSWLWHMPVLAIWVLWLPLAAAMIALASLTVFLARQSKSEHTTWFRPLFNLARNWPLIVTALAGLGVVALVQLHDTAQCVVGNPVHEAHHLHQAWLCVQQNQGITTTIQHLSLSN